MSKWLTFNELIKAEESLRRAPQAEKPDSTHQPSSSIQLGLVKDQPAVSRTDLPAIPPRKEVY